MPESPYSLQFHSIYQEKRRIDAKGKFRHGKTKMKMARKRELPCVRRSRSLYGERVVRGVALTSMEKKNSDEETKKKQKNRIAGKVILVAKGRGLNSILFYVQKW
jgi:hypothetical protein